MKQEIWPQQKNETGNLQKEGNKVTTSEELDSLFPGSVDDAREKRVRESQLADFGPLNKEQAAKLIEIVEERSRKYFEKEFNHEEQTRQAMLDFYKGKGWYFETQEGQMELQKIKDEAIGRADYNPS